MAEHYQEPAGKNQGTRSRTLLLTNKGLDKMRKLLFTIALIFVSLNMNAENFIYCELVGTAKFMSNKVKVKVDYGQESSFWKGISYMKDENGNNIEFNSMVDAMNYFGKQGWGFVQAYAVTVGNQNVYHWLLKKTVTEEELNKALEVEKD